MPQSQGPVVIQNQRPVGALGVFGSQLLGNLGQGLGQAAGGFLSDLIHPDPKDDLIKVQTEAQQQKNDQDALASWEEYQKKRGAVLGEDEARRFFSSQGKDEESADRLAKLGTPTMSNKAFADFGQGVDEYRAANNKPFEAPGGSGPMAGVPPMPSAEESKEVAPSPADSPVTASAFGTGEDNTTPAPSAQEEQATNQVLSVTPEVIKDTTKEAPPVLTASSLPPEDRVRAPQPLTNDAKMTAMRKMRNAQGLIQSIGQTFMADKTGAVDPAQRGMALNAMATVDRDMADVINTQRIAEGEDPLNLVGKNYRQMAFNAMARELVNTPGWLAKATPEQIESFKQHAAEYESAYVSNQDWTNQDWDYVNKLKANLIPQGWSQGAALQFMYMQDQFKHQSDENAKNRAQNQQQFDATLGFNKEKFGLEQQEFALRSGLVNSQIEAMNISNAEARSMQGAKLQEFQLKMQQAKQELQNGKLTLERNNLLNMAAIQGLVETHVDQAARIVGMEIQGQDKKLLVAQNSLTKIQMAQDALYKTAAQDIKVTEGSNLADVYQKNPTRLNNDYAKMTGAQKADVDTLAQQISGNTNPNSLDKAQAMAAVSHPSYRDYLVKRARYTEQAAGFSAQIDSLAKEQPDIAQRIQEVSAQLSRPNAASARAQYQDIIGKYLNATVVRTNQEMARKGITGVPTETGKQFILNNPELIPYMLGQASVSGGKVTTKGSGSVLSSEEVAGLYTMGRGARGADGSTLTLDAFGNLPVHGMTLRQYFGPKKLQDAYNTYSIFSRGGY